MRQAYDYWQDQPGNRPPGGRTRPAWRCHRPTALISSAPRPGRPRSLSGSGREANDVCTCGVDGLESSRSAIGSYHPTTPRHLAAISTGPPYRLGGQHEARLATKPRRVPDGDNPPRLFGRSGTAAGQLHLCFQRLPNWYGFRIHSLGRQHRQRSCGNSGTSASLPMLTLSPSRHEPAADDESSSPVHSGSSDTRMTVSHHRGRAASANLGLGSHRRWLEKAESLWLPPLPFSKIVDPYCDTALFERSAREALGD